MLLFLTLLVSSKVITMLDTCGLPRYQSTTLRSLTGYAPDYAMLVVSANSGYMSEITKEHLSLCCVLRIPVFICMTKLDLATKASIRPTMSSLYEMLKLRDRFPLNVASNADVILASQMAEAGTVPIFFTSSIGGAGIGNLITFLSYIPKPPTMSDSSLNSKALFYIEEVFEHPSAGLVVGGVMKSGVINAGSELWLGPPFRKILAKSIHRQRVRTNVLVSGQAGTIAISHLQLSCGKIAKARKGMVLIENSGQAPKSVSTFTASSTVSDAMASPMLQSQAIALIHSIRAPVRVHAYGHGQQDPEVWRDGGLRSGSHGIITWTFVKGTEYIETGMAVLFISGRTKIAGTITHVVGIT